jgi:hypothetical protein
MPAQQALCMHVHRRSSQQQHQLLFVLNGLPKQAMDMFLVIQVSCDYLSWWWGSCISIGSASAVFGRSIRSNLYDAEESLYCGIERN